MDSKKWFILYTKQGQEKKVADFLASRKIVSYCPLSKQTLPWREREFDLYRPLFTSLVFVQLNSPDEIHLRSVSGMLSFVYWLGEKVVIPNEEIQAIENFLVEYAGIKLEKTPVNNTDHVRVIYGPLVVSNGEDFEVRNSPVSVILPTMGYVLIAKERKRAMVKLQYSRFRTYREKMLRKN